MAGPNYLRRGAAATHGVGGGVTSKLVVVKFEDGSEAHVTPEHAAQIRSRAAKFLQNGGQKAYSTAYQNRNSTGHRVSGTQRPAGT